jgi:murein DD-endopeptidase MepM/ murein hydrolase activator NlpD
MDNENQPIVTRSGGWRLHWLAVAGAAPLLGVMAAFGTVQNEPEPVPFRTVVETLELAGAPRGEAGNVYFLEDRLQGNDTLAVLLARLGASRSDTENILRSRQASRLLRHLGARMEVQASVGEDGKLQTLWFIAGRDTLYAIDRVGDGFSASELPAEITHRIEARSGEVRSTLFGAADAAGIPDNVASQISDIFAGDIDFHRDLRRGDRFTVIFEMDYHRGRAVRSGRVLAAEFANRKKTYRAVWFEDSVGRGGYYTPEGKNLRKAFLRSPLEYSRITSGFGIRHHPILQQWLAHNGIDYAAPAGTRVRATGDGRVEFAGRKSNYGLLVALRHNGGYGTYYAHLSRFARGIRPGARVAQGDIVGYVGQTGWATGPHLHYEFHVNNQNRNPLTMAFPSANPVSAQQLAAFRRATEALAARLDLLNNGNLALLE